MDVIMNIAGISIWGTIDILEHQHWQRAINPALYRLEMRRLNKVVSKGEQKMMQ
jgi:hypothetical protein